MAAAIPQIRCIICVELSRTNGIEPIDKATQIRIRQQPLAQQVAALPWRLAGGGIEVLLVTSREAKRWVIPRGWPMPGRTAAQAAAREAFEEAGLKGTVTPVKIGDYGYRKRLPDGSLLDCRADVFAFWVRRQLAQFPEKSQRVARWFHPREAARLVEEPELADLILAFAAGGYMRCA